ncbi:tetratricopeptide repeat protein [Streptomyces ossamyceticus]|uniref:Tetratricopeptide repeat protein n=1 Tax=Streptomyces ossamyceticus TaxID=249581 RepID=A0ABV2UUW2_9ACTN
MSGVMNEESAAPGADAGRGNGPEGGAGRSRDDTAARAARWRDGDAGWAARWRDGRAGRVTWWRGGAPWWRGRAVAGALVGCAVLGGGVLGVAPDGGGGAAGRDDAGAGRVAGAPGAPGAPARGPVVAEVRARAGAGVLAAGVSVGSDDVAVLVADREKRVRTRPRDSAAWAVLGAAYVERARRTGRVSDLPRAETALRASLRLRPRGNADALDGMTALANTRRDFPAALRWGERAVAQSPGRWTSYALLLDAYDGLGRYKAVRGTLERLLDADSGPAAQAWAARVYWDQGRREDAAAALADAAAGAATPAEEAALWVRAGELAWERGEPAEASRYFTAATRADPGAADALAGRGRVLAATGRTAEGVRAYRAALARRPSARVALELGELYASLGRVGAAAKQYGVVRELVRRSAAAGVDEALVLGALEADHGDPAKAVRVLRAEWRRQPGLKVADALGWALHRAGSHEEALEYARRATDPARGGEVRSAVYVHHRAEIERALGLTASARRHEEEARRINPHLRREG